MRILFVDDEAPLARMGSLMLKAGGYQVTTAGDSAAALAAFEAEPDGFAAVATDHTMPGMTGIELLQAVRAMRPTLPVMLCSGQPEMADQLTASGLGGAVRFLPKPYTQTGLQDAIGELLGSQD